MLVTVMQTSYQKIDHKIKHYCNYKDICNDIINESLHQLFQQNWNNNCDKDVDNFFLSYSKVLDKYAPRRKKYMLSLIISRLWIKVCLKLLCDEKNFPRVFLKYRTAFSFCSLLFPYKWGRIQTRLKLCMQKWPSWLYRLIVFYFI